MSNKNWKYLGEVEKINRPANSLLDLDIHFDQARPAVPLSADLEKELRGIVAVRLKARQFDNFVRREVPDAVFEAVEEDAADDEDMAREEMVDLFWEIDAELSRMCDFGGVYALGIEKTREKNIFAEKKRVGRGNEKILRDLRKKRNVRVV